MMKLFSFATDEKHPCHIFVVGNRGAGKTCFLSGLDEYGKAHQGGELAVIHDDGKTARELDELDSIRRSGRWPLPTAHTTHLQLTLKSGSGRNPFFGRLHVVDYPGEDLKKNLLELDPEAQKAISNGLGQASILLMLLDPTKDVDVGLDMACSPEEVQRRQDILLKTIGDVMEGRIAKLRRGRPKLMLIVTKGDLLPDDRRGKKLNSILIERNRSFYNKLAGWVKTKNVETTFVSAFGPLNQDASPPANAKPFGYDNILEIIERWKWEEQTRVRRTQFAVAAAVTILMALGVWIYAGIQRNGYIAVIERDALHNVIQFIEDRWPNQPPHYVVQAIEERLKGERIRIQREINERANDWIYLRELRKQARLLERCPGNPNAQADSVLVDEINASLEKATWTTIQQTPRGDSSLREKCFSYISDFPQGRYVNQVRDTLRSIEIYEVDAIIRELQGITPLQREHLRIKARQIHRLSEDHSAEVHRRNIDVRRLRLAGETASLIAGTPTSGLRIRLNSAGFENWGGSRSSN